MIPVPKNRIRCRYCAWETYRFRGKQRGEASLRLHVIDEHEAAYCAAQGLQAMGEDRPWMLDEAEIGEQAL